MEGFMKMIKKNQVIIFVIALMLVAAGYLNYTATNGTGLIPTSGLADSEQMASIGDAKLVNTEPTEDEEKGQETNTTNTVEKESIQNTNNTTVETNGEITKTNGTTKEDQYFTKSRLERDTMYSQMIESYQKILENTTISSEQKTISQTEIKHIHEQKNAIMIAENLIKNKGFEDLVIFINDDSVSVIVKSEELKEEQIAQIQSILVRELKVELEHIHISNKE